VSLFKAASTVSLLTLASRVTGLVRDLLMASMFGASALTDAFNVAFRIPNLFRRLFAEGAFAQAFVPVLAATKTKEGEEATHRLIAAVATALAWTLLLTACWVCWARRAGVGCWPAACAKPRGFDAAVLMTRWMFPYIGFMSMVALAAGILNTWKHFAVPAATPVLLNLCMIGAAWLGAPQLEARGIEPIYAMAGGVMLGACCSWRCKSRCCFAWGSCPHWGDLGCPARGLAEPGVRRVLTLMAPILLGVGWRRCP
jgi:putative peptidoglycan lipid II flippase